MSGFTLRADTGDGVEILLGGLCRAGWTQPLEEALRPALQKTMFVPCDDPYLVDVKLHRVVTEAILACEAILKAGDVKVVAAVTPASGPACGAILGAPFSEAESAEGTLEQLGGEYYAVCWPGAFGAAFAAPNHAAADSLCEQIRNLCAEAAAKRLEHTEFILACDGGNGRTGCLFLGDGTAVTCLVPKAEHAERSTGIHEADAHKATGIPAAAEGCGEQAREGSPM